MKITPDSYTQETDAARVYFSPDCAATKQFLETLESIGHRGQIAAELWRVLRWADRKEPSEATKRIAILCELLDADNYGLVWGWAQDPNTSGDILIIDLPTGQAAFRSLARHVGPYYQGRWNGSYQATGKIIGFAQRVYDATEETRERLASMTGSEMSLQGFFHNVYVPNRLGASSPRSLDDYRSAIRKLERRHGGPLLLSELSDDLLSGMMTDLIQRGRSIATANAVRRHIRAVWTLAHEREIVSRPCRVKPFREPKQQREAWTRQEFGRIIEAACEQDGQVGAVAASVWWPAFLYLAVNTGARVSALMAIRTEDCWSERRQVWIRWQEQKQKADQRFDLWPETVQLLERLDAHGRGLPCLFDDWKADRTGPGWRRLTTNYRMILNRTGLPCESVDMFHKLRRTFATWFVVQTGSPERCQRQLGHSCISVTERYLDWSQIERDNVSEIMPAPALPPIVAESKSGVA